MAWFEAMCDALIAAACHLQSTHAAECSNIRLMEREDFVIAFAVAHAYRELGAPQYIADLWAADVLAAHRFLDRV